MITLFRSVLTEFELGGRVRSSCSAQTRQTTGRAKNVNNKRKKKNLAKFTNFTNYIENRDDWISL